MWRNKMTNTKIDVNNKNNEKVEKKQSKKLKRPTLPVVVNTHPTCSYFGMFETLDGKQLLHINVKLLEDPSLRFHALETILHEGRHAYQYNIIKNKKIRFYEFKKKRWKRNYSGYITSTEDPLFYSMQPIERDAQKYAIKQMSKFKRKFKHEKDFYITLQRMIDRYNNTEKSLKEKHGIFYNAKLNRKIRKKVDF